MSLSEDSETESETESEIFFSRKRTLIDVQDINSPTSGKPSEKKVPRASSYRYSQTSDHKPVFMEFYLKVKGITERLVALTYNMSFASDLGIARGSEAKFVQRAINADSKNPRSYWINASNLVKHFVDEKNPTIMYFQEMNDREKITRDPKFKGGYQALLELLAQQPIIYSVENPCLPQGSYYKQGTYLGKNNKNYGFVAYSIKKQDNTFPTVLTIWNTDTLGGFGQFYGNDLGLHKNYNFSTGNIGRNFSCVKTVNGVILINLHGPNVEDYMPITDEKLVPAIQDYMQQANSAIVFDNKMLVVIGGDTNDVQDKATNIEFDSNIYNYKSPAPKSCCAEFFDIRGTNDTLDKEYRNAGDKFWVINPESFNPSYRNELYEPTNGSSVIYGGRRQSRNLKKKSLKQRKTIKKRHYKLNKKKALKKRRSFRRKTIKHTY